MLSCANDTVIIGAGPAGTACAILLAQRGVHVTLVHDDAYTRSSFGEITTSESTELLRKLDIDVTQPPLAYTPCRGLFSAWGEHRSPQLRPGLFNPFGPDLLLQRPEFDQQLRARAQNAGVILCGPLVESSPVHDGKKWTLTVEQDGQPRRIRAAVVVEALGRSRTWTETPCRRRLNCDSLMVWSTVISRSSSTAKWPDDAGLVESTQSGWWYTSPCFDNSFAVCFFTDSDLFPRAGTGSMTSRDEFLKIQLLAAPNTLERLAGSDSIRTYRWHGCDARTGIRHMAANDHWICAGDSLASLDPLSGRGIFEALRSGIEVAELIAAGHLSDRVKRDDFAYNVAERYNRYLIQRHHTYSNERTWSESVFWSRRHSIGVATMPSATDMHDTEGSVVSSSQSL